MTAYVALLRAVNVGGTGKLPMADLKSMGEACGFANVRTFIASGNLLFETDLGEAEIKQRLEVRLADYAKKPVEVFVRSMQELEVIVAANPFADAHPSRMLVFFGDNPISADFMGKIRDQNGERIALGRREFYVDYGEGIRFTKLKLPDPLLRTGRSINSVQRILVLLQKGLAPLTKS